MCFHQADEAEQGQFPYQHPSGRRAVMSGGGGEIGSAMGRLNHREKGSLTQVGNRSAGLRTHRPPRFRTCV